MDSAGQTVQLRGVNASGLEFTAIQGWDANDPWGGADPNFAAIAAWHANVVRMPLNEDSWLGLQCAKDPTNLSGSMENADPGGNYRATVEQAVTAANAAGLYVDLDLHWSAPNDNGVPLCAMTQNVMASADHADAFWSSVAQTFRSNPSVMFELFNEPFESNWSTSGTGSAAQRILNGGTATGFMWGYGDSSGVWHGGTDTSVVWQTAGMQSMLNAVRATGASNVVLVGSDSWSQEVSDALTTIPTDSAHQLAVAWHPYPDYDYGTPQVRCINLPSCSATEMAAAVSVAAQYPVVATEFGDNLTTSAGDSSPWSQLLLPWADQHGISYLGWTWDVWQDSANVLIRDSSGTPSYGFGTYLKEHLLCRANGGC